MNRKYVYVFKSANGTCNVINYDAANCAVNTFLTLFDVWHCNGHFKLNANLEQEVWFECDLDFMELVKNETMQEAFNRMGVKIVFEPPECAM